MNPEEIGLEKPGRAYFAPDDLNDPALTRLIFRLGLPAVAGLSINAVHHTINMVFVGMIGAHEIAAITVVLPILMMIGAIGEGLGVGVATAVGRALGSDSPQRANVTASTLMVLAVPLGIVLTTGILVFRRELLGLFGASEAIMPLAEHYLIIVAFSVTLTMLQILSDFIAISEGNTRFSMWTLLGCFALNIILDPIMIFGFGFGLAGAAMATILSQIAAIAAYALYFRKRIGTLHLSARFAAFRADILKPVLSIGLPTTLTSMLSSISFAVLFTYAGFYHGDAGVAGVGIALRVLTLGMLPVIGLSLGGQAVLSFAWGAGKTPRLLAASNLLLLLTSAFCVAYGLGAVLLRYPIAAIFTDDLEIARIAALTIVVTHIPFIFFGMRQILVVLLQGADASGALSPSTDTSAGCAQVRTLSDRGHQLAQKLGARFAAKAVRIDKVLTSPVCNAQETARLAFGAAPVEIVSALGPLADDDAAKQSQIDQIRAMIAEFKSSGNLVMMTDRANITALTGIVPRPTEAVVVSPPEAGETVHIAGRIIFD